MFYASKKGVPGGPPQFSFGNVDIILPQGPSPWSPFFSISKSIQEKHNIAKVI